MVLKQKDVIGVTIPVISLSCSDSFVPELALKVS
jgi:hypothetical protein